MSTIHDDIESVSQQLKLEGQVEIAKDLADSLYGSTGGEILSAARFHLGKVAKGEVSDITYRRVENLIVRINAAFKR